VAILRSLRDEKTWRDPEEIAGRLGPLGIRFERWNATRDVGAGASEREVLAAYAEDVSRLKGEGGYVTADVIDVSPETPGLETMLEKFRREHWHDEDEVRFIVEGRGLFHVNVGGDLLAIEVEPGDLLRVPRGTHHWFDLCAERRIRAIRLFQDPSGWTPHYTGSGIDAEHQPVCFGPGTLPTRQG